MIPDGFLPSLMVPIDDDDDGDEDGDEDVDAEDQDGDKTDEDKILREIKASGISKSDMARMAPWVRIHKYLKSWIQIQTQIHLEIQIQIQVKREIVKCGLSTDIFMQQTEVILRAFDKVKTIMMRSLFFVVTIFQQNIPWTL